MAWRNSPFPSKASPPERRLRMLRKPDLAHCGGGVEKPQLRSGLRVTGWDLQKLGGLGSVFPRAPQRAWSTPATRSAPLAFMGTFTAFSAWPRVHTKKTGCCFDPKSRGRPKPSSDPSGSTWPTCSNRPPRRRGPWLLRSNTVRVCLFKKWLALR